MSSPTSEISTETPSNTALVPIDAVATQVQALLAGFGDLTDETLQLSAASFEFPGVAGHAFLLPDLVLDRHLNVRLVECNGTNGAGSSVASRDLPRVQHELAVMMARGIDPTGDIVMITPESPDTRSTPEIRTRAVLRAVLVGQATGVPVTVARAGQPMRPGPAAVWGPIPDIVDELTLDASGLAYAGRPVVFLNNVNVLVELARRLDRDIDSVVSAVARHTMTPDPIHEGAQLALLSLDKIAQQDLAARTTLIKEVAAELVGSDVDEIVAVALATAERFGGAIVKPMAASGGTGVIPVDPTANPVELRREVLEATAKLQAKYGDGWEKTCPFAVFEFIDILPAVTPAGGRRWDLRFQIDATPERTLITPLTARLCPAPIGPVLDRASSVNNLTNRSTSEAGRLAVRDLLEMLDADDSLLATFATAAYEFVRIAIGRGAVKDVL